MAVRAKKIVKLVPPSARYRAEVKANVIGRLQDALVEAKDGQFDGIMILAHRPDGGNYTSYSKMNDRMLFVGMFEYVKWRMLRDYDEE